MALADISTGGEPRRLDSWKEIAEYLGRDVRTATRWEAEGMPLHRVPGGKGRSVFAFTNEIDAWMAGGRRPAAAAPPAAPVQPASRPAPPTFIAAAAGGALVIALAGIAVLTRGREDLDITTLRAAVTSTSVSLADASGASRVLHAFGPVQATPVERKLAEVRTAAPGAPGGVLVGIMYYEDLAARSVARGELLELALEGGVRWRFAFDDVLTFRDGTFSGPWAVSDWQADSNGGARRYAVAGHDFTWWASMLAVLDQDGRRLSTFVNPGWIETVRWLDHDRLAIAGFNNARDEAMFAVLKAHAVDGQAPGSTGTPYVCVTCPSSVPLAYATFARSELNRLTASRFNRAAVSLVGDRVLVTTSETGRDRSEATAIYEFDRDLRFLRARYAERYWDEHGRLEREGRLTHTRETCPERDGPGAIHLWQDGNGWVRVTPAGQAP